MPLGTNSGQHAVVPEKGELPLLPDVGEPRPSAVVGAAVVKGALMGPAPSQSATEVLSLTSSGAKSQMPQRTRAEALRWAGLSERGDLCPLPERWVSVSSSVGRRS